MCIAVLVLLYLSAANAVRSIASSIGRGWISTLAGVSGFGREFDRDNRRRIAGIVVGETQEQAPGEQAGKKMHMQKVAGLMCVSPDWAVGERQTGRRQTLRELESKR